jgi:AP-3 complex subunit sigma
MDKVVEGVRAQGRVAKRPVNESRPGLGRLGMGSGGFAWAGR